MFVGSAQFIKVRYLSLRKCRASVICASQSPECQHLSEARTKAVTVTCPNWQRPGQQRVWNLQLRWLKFHIFLELSGRWWRMIWWYCVGGNTFEVFLRCWWFLYRVQAKHISDLWFKPSCGKIVRDVEPWLIHIQIRSNWHTNARFWAKCWSMRGIGAMICRHVPAWNWSWNSWRRQWPQWHH